MKYFLKNNKECDAWKYGLQSGRKFDEWFVEVYLQFYEVDEK